MGRPFVLPDLGEGLTEAEIVAVLVREGEVIREDAPLLEVETDKARVEIPSPMGGRIEAIHVSPGETVKVGAALVTFADAAVGSAAAGAPDKSPAPATSRAPGAAPVAQRATPAAPPRSAPGPSPPVPSPVHSPPSQSPLADTSRAADGAPARPERVGPVPATPATRRLARELGVDLRAVRPTGPGGRVTDADVRAAGAPATGEPGPAAAPATRPPVATPLAPAPFQIPPLPRFEQWGPVERAPLSHLRRTIAERMTLSAAIVPHVTHFDRADITDLDALIRANLEAARARGVTLTLTSFLLKAAALTLAAHPSFNASLDAAAGELVLKRYHHLGVAVATERGLIVPVIRDVDRKPLLALAAELGALAQRVRDGKATLDDLRGGTFTITNIGALGGTGAIPIINYPEVAILGVARAREEPVVRGGQIVARLILPLTLTFDHRVADGANGARFAADLVRRLEHPDQLLLEL